jgi:hypothetical protein
MQERTIKRTSLAGVIPRREINAVVKAVHVVPFEKKWRVQKTGKERIRKVFETKEQAEEYARELSRTKRVKLFVHSKNGRVEMKKANGREHRLVRR